MCEGWRFFQFFRQAVRRGILAFLLSTMRSSSGPFEWAFCVGSAEGAAHVAPFRSPIL